MGMYSNKYQRNDTYCETSQKQRQLTLTVILSTGNYKVPMITNILQHDKCLAQASTISQGKKRHDSLSGGGGGGGSLLNKDVHSTANAMSCRQDPSKPFGYLWALLT